MCKFPTSCQTILNNNIKNVYKLKHILLTIYLQLCHNVLAVIQYYIIIKKNKDS